MVADNRRLAGTRSAFIAPPSAWGGLPGCVKMDRDSGPKNPEKGVGYLADFLPVHPDTKSRQLEVRILTPIFCCLKDPSGPRLCPADLVDIPRSTTQEITGIFPAFMSNLLITPTQTPF